MIRGAGLDIRLIERGDTTEACVMANADRFWPVRLSR